METKSGDGKGHTPAAESVAGETATSGSFVKEFSSFADDSEGMTDYSGFIQNQVTAQKQRWSDIEDILPSIDGEMINFGGVLTLPRNMKESCSKMVGAIEAAFGELVTIEFAAGRETDLLDKTKTFWNASKESRNAVRDELRKNEKEAFSQVEYVMGMMIGLSNGAIATPERASKKLLAGRETVNAIKIFELAKKAKADKKLCKVVYALNVDSEQTCNDLSEHVGKIFGIGKGSVMLFKAIGAGYAAIAKKVSISTDEWWKEAKDHCLAPDQIVNNLHGTTTVQGETKGEKPLTAVWAKDGNRIKVSDSGLKIYRHKVPNHPNLKKVSLNPSSTVYTSAQKDALKDIERTTKLSPDKEEKEIIKVFFTQTDYEKAIASIDKFQLARDQVEKVFRSVENNQKKRISFVLSKAREEAGDKPSSKKLQEAFDSYTKENPDVDIQKIIDGVDKNETRTERFRSIFS